MARLHVKLGHVAEGVKHLESAARALDSAFCMFPWPSELRPCRDLDFSEVRAVGSYHVGHRLPDDQHMDSHRHRACQSLILLT